LLKPGFSRKASQSPATCRRQSATGRANNFTSDANQQHLSLQFQKTERRREEIWSARALAIKRAGHLWFWSAS
jgi:hypothetical protein